MTNTATPNSGALSHIRVLDLSRVLAGPWAGQTLATDVVPLGTSLRKPDSGIQADFQCIISLSSVNYLPIRGLPARSRISLTKKFFKLFQRDCCKPECPLLADSCLLQCSN